jgi:hypothetical protein
MLEHVFCKPDSEPEINERFSRVEPFYHIHLASSEKLAGGGANPTPTSFDRRMRWDKPSFLCPHPPRLRWIRRGWLWNSEKRHSICSESIFPIDSVSIHTGKAHLLLLYDAFFAPIRRRRISYSLLYSLGDTNSYINKRSLALRRFELHICIYIIFPCSHRFDGLASMVQWSSDKCIRPRKIVSDITP